MITLNPLDSVFKLVELYSDKEKSQRLRRSFLEALLREMKTNQAILLECKSLNNNTEAAAKLRPLFKVFKTNAFEMVCMSGFPLSDLIKGTLSNSFNPENKYKQYLKNTNQKVDVLEKAYHRLILYRTLADMDLKKRFVKLGYAEMIVNGTVQILQGELNK